MADTTKAAVKMYRIRELGDCFLLSFTKGKAVSHMLIDCGAFRQSKDRLKNIVADIKKQLKGEKLNVVIGTHQHNDHVNGFFHAESTFREIGIEEVWLSWLDNPKDKLAREIGGMYNNFANKLTAISKGLNKIPAAQGQSFAKTKMQLEETLQALGLGAREKATDKTPPVTPQKAIDALKGLSSKPVSYLKPGEIIDLPGLPKDTVRIYVLGPPRKEDNLFDKSPTKEQTYDPHRLMMVDQLAEKFLSAMTNYQGKEDKAEEDHFPFNKKFKLKERSIHPAIKKRYREKGQEWRTISMEWLTQATRLGLWLDDFTNNSSLVLAIELVKSGKFLLFVGDAMTGNWVSWQDIKWKNNLSIDDILSKTVLYKVGHHGSHNASLKPLCEKMTHQDLIAMIPVDKSDGNIKKEDGWKMPAEKLNKRLVELTKNRVIRMEDVFDKDCHPSKEPARSSWKKAGIKPTFNDMFIEVEIKDI